MKLFEIGDIAVKDRRNGDVWFSGYEWSELEALKKDENVVAIMNEETKEVIFERTEDTRTNIQMFEGLASFEPERRGMVTMKEINYISKELNLNNRTMLDLRNLRDFTVLYYGNFAEDPAWAVNMMSAITSVIDLKIMNKGGEV